MKEQKTEEQNVPQEAGSGQNGSDADKPGQQAQEPQQDEYDNYCPWG